MDRLIQRIPLKAQLIGDLRSREPLVQELLRLLEDVFCQDMRASRSRRFKKRRRSAFPVFLDPPLHADRAHAKRSDNLHLRALPVHDKLTGNQTETLLIGFWMRVNRKGAMKIIDRTVLLPVREYIGDVAFLDIGKVG